MALKINAITASFSYLIVGKYSNDTQTSKDPTWPVYSFRGILELHIGRELGFYSVGERFDAASGLNKISSYATITTSRTKT